MLHTKLATQKTYRIQSNQNEEAKYNQIDKCETKPSDKLNPVSPYLSVFKPTDKTNLAMNPSRTWTYNFQKTNQMKEHESRMYPAQMNPFPNYPQFNYLQNNPNLTREINKTGKACLFFNDSKNVVENQKNLVNVYQKNSNNVHFNETALNQKSVYLKYENRTNFGDQTKTPLLTSTPKVSRGSSNAVLSSTEYKDQMCFTIKPIYSSSQKYVSETPGKQLVFESFFNGQKSHNQTRTNENKQISCMRSINAEVQRGKFQIYSSGSLPRKLEDVSNRYQNKIPETHYGFGSPEDPIRYRMTRLLNVN